MDEDERIKRQQAEVDARRAAFLSHIKHCEDCKNGGRIMCAELVLLLRLYQRAQKLLSELVLISARAIREEKNLDEAAVIETRTPELQRGEATRTAT